MEAAYEALIRAHARKPRHGGRPSCEVVSGEGNNPKCGDALTVHLEAEPLRSGRLGGVWFEAKACALCVASASMMTEVVEGVTIQEAVALARQTGGCHDDDSRTGFGKEWEETFRPVLAAAPQRGRCVELPWVALENALRMAGSHD